MKTIIIGGVAGGASAATRLRRLDESHEIVVLERSGYVSFANCGLPYYIGGTIADRRNLLLQTPKSLNARFGLDVRVKSEVIAIDPARPHGHGARPGRGPGVHRGLRPPGPVPRGVAHRPARSRASSGR